jgi:O-antigen/teichoic acid export membrane protein
MFHSAVVSSSMPLFAQLSDRRDHAGMEHLYRTTSKWTYAINLPLFLVLVLFPQAILSLFGEDFQTGFGALMIMAFAGLANAGTGTSGAILDMAGYTSLKLVNSGAALGSALLLNVLLIPPLGLLGAAVALSVSTAILNLLRLAEVGWLLRLNPYDRTFLKPTLAAALAVAAALVASGVAGSSMLISALAGIAALGLVYMVALVRLGLSDDDRAVLRGMWHRIRRRGPRAKRQPAAVGDPPIAEVPR